MNIFELKAENEELRREVAILHNAALSTPEAASISRQDLLRFSSFNNCMTFVALISISIFLNPP
jgi:hypothetical protein